MLPEARFLHPVAGVWSVPDSLSPRSAFVPAARFASGVSGSSLDSMGHAPAQLEVGETAGVLLVVLGDSEDGAIELTVPKLLKSHSGCDGGKHGDI